MYDEDSNAKKKFEDFYKDNNELLLKKEKTDSISLLNTEQTRNKSNSSEKDTIDNAFSLDKNKYYGNNYTEIFNSPSFELLLNSQNIINKDDITLYTGMTCNKKRNNQYENENLTELLLEKFNEDIESRIYERSIEYQIFNNNDLDNNKRPILSPGLINDDPYDKYEYRNEHIQYPYLNPFLGHKRYIFKQYFNKAFNKVFVQPQNNNNDSDDCNEFEDEKMKIKIFNYENYTEFSYENNKDFKIEFIPLKNIIQTYENEIKGLWNDKEKIFENKERLLKIENNNSKIYSNTSKYLNENKGIEKNDKRKYDTDEMICKIKSNLSHSYIEATNSFQELKLRPISAINKNLINTKIKADFNLIYLKQPLYSILSNESTEGNSNKIVIEKIMNDRNKRNQPIIKHLNLTIQNCLDIFRYKEKNNIFKYKLLDFLKEEYNYQISIKKENSEICGEYIASLILVSYNFENFFYIRKKKERKEKKEKVKKEKGKLNKK